MTEVFMFTDYTFKMRGPLRKRGILVRVKNNVDSISPLAVVGNRSEKFLKENIGKFDNGNVHNVICLKKNFANMISRNPEKFESNFKVYPLGENVDIKNNK